MRAIFCIFLLSLTLRAAEEVVSTELPSLLDDNTHHTDPSDATQDSKLIIDVTNVNSPQERQLKDSFKDTLETSDIIDVSSQTTQLDNTGGSRPGRSLQDGNPVFKPEFHHTKIDYFQLTMHEINRNRARIGEVTRFVSSWMNIKGSEETLKLAQLRVKKRLVNNRFIATYTNLETQQTKIYYLDVDFSDGKTDRSRVGRIQTIDYLHNEGSNKDYLSMYGMTLEEDCRTIQQARHNPQEIQCNPWVTRDGFVIPHVYQVTMRFRFRGKVVKRKGRFFVRSKIIGPETSPLRPSPVNLPSTKSIIKMINERIKSIPFFENKNLILSQLKQHAMRERIESFSNQIAGWELKNRSRLRRIEGRYHANLSRALRVDRANKRRDNTNFDRTYGVMRRAANRVNAFNIRSVIRRTARRLEDRQVVRAHRAKARYYQREIALMDLMEKLDHMRYLADKHLDDNFDHYYAAEYFGK